MRQVKDRQNSQEWERGGVASAEWVITGMEFGEDGAQCFALTDGKKKAWGECATGYIARRRGGKGRSYGETRIDCDEDVVDGRIGGNEQKLRTCRVVRVSVWAGPNVLLSV